jgi:hypothetical protein
MGSNLLAPPINEAINILNSIDPDSLKNFREEFKSVLGDELKLGRQGGEDEYDNKLNKLRAKIVIEALQTAKKRAESELSILKNRIQSARKVRLISQMVSVVLSSGVLGAIAIGDKTMTIATAIFSAISSLGSILAENKERLLKQSDSDIYIAFESAAQASYKAGLAIENLKLLSINLPESEELRSSITEANEVCEQLNMWLIKIYGSQ